MIAIRVGDKRLVSVYQLRVGKKKILPVKRRVLKRKSEWAEWVCKVKGAKVKWEDELNKIYQVI